jgi:NADH-quinone oxidoreductase subunit N
VVAAFQRDSVRSTEAGVKYFVLGSVASGMLLFGASLIYGFCGGTAFVEISKALIDGRGEEIGTVIGLVFVVAGLAFKVSAVPFHMWTPDVYEGAPTPVTALFAVAPKIAAVSLLVSVLMGPFKPLFAQWQQIIVVASVLSMALGAFAALRQPNIKRLMAYSSIGNVGYILLGLAAGSEKGIQAVVFYLAIYLVMTLGVFATILLMKRRGVMVEGVADLAGLGRTHPMMAFALLLFMFSLAGIPPLAGFWGKLYIFMAAVEAKLYWPAVLGVLASVVASYYYLRIVKVMYFDEPGEALDQPVFGVNRVVAFAAAIIVAVFSLAPQPLSVVAAAAAKGLFP